jgi:hypothetical protein
MGHVAESYFIIIPYFPTVLDPDLAVFGQKVECSTVHAFEVKMNCFYILMVPVILRYQVSSGIHFLRNAIFKQNNKFFLSSALRCPKVLYSFEQNLEPPSSK